MTSLRGFFPKANLQKLIEIEPFPNKIQTILQDESEVAKASLEEGLAPLKQMIKYLEKQAVEICPAIIFSKEFLAAYTYLDRRLHKLEDENWAFDRRNTSQNEKKQATGWIANGSSIKSH